MEKTKLTGRRDFMKKSAMGAAGLSFAFSAKSYGNILGANDRVNMGVIGLNGRGVAHVSAIQQVKKAQLISLCDVDKNTFDRLTGQFPNADFGKTKTFGDFRKMLEQKSLDAVTIATPDHWHTPMAIAAMQAGKHVYVEKPSSHNLSEGEMLVASQKKEGKVLQIGNQQRSAPTSIRAVRDIRDGIIGDVYFAKAWYSNTRKSIGKVRTTAPPGWLNWELWQGPAPRRDFSDTYVHYNWHWFWHWGTGEIHNNGLHELDICRWAMGVEAPDRVDSAGGRFHFDDDWEFYDTQVVNYRFGENKMITWEGKSCNGMPYHGRGRGATIHGTKGTILLDRNGYLHFDLDGKLVAEHSEESMSATTDTVGIGALDILHMGNFIRSVTEGEPLASPAEEINKSHVLCHLGNIAQKLNRPVILKDGQIVNDPEAVRMRSREYEPGWEPRV